MSGCHSWHFLFLPVAALNLKKWRIPAAGTDYDNARAKCKLIFNHKIKSEYHG
jgi:hypothetical protein